ncbi:hypothetical protein ACTMSW_26335 [Micromonospora sp. BQ11]|uniref:hypothetical protein n=1 Tax=Micromonospora sp. BQ11 TaxID=3452212 RepID=UPI003F8A0F39
MAATLTLATVALVAAPPASAATAATVTVSGTQWGVSTCNLGAVEGNTRFDVNELKDMGVNAYRVYGGVSRWERADDDGTYGSPTIAEIKADPNRVNWSAWDTAMTSPPRGSDYSWSVETGNLWQGNARTLFQTLKNNGIKPVVTLRDQDNFGGNTWLASPPTSTADWNEWWAHAFATVYWFNVRNDYRVDDWEIHNEPDFAGQGWKGTKEQYYDFVRYTSDAIRHVYATYLPGRTPRIHAPATLSGSTWPRDVLANVGDQFNTMNVHNYNSDITSYNQQVHGWMNDAGAGNYPLWLGEWGTYTQSYDTLGMSLTTLKNMIRGSRPGNEHVDGSLIFSMYDWISSTSNDTFEGLVSGSGDASWTYYAFRMGSRALQGCRPTYRSTASTGDITAITTKDSAGNIYVLAANSGTGGYDLDIDLSALASSGTGTLWRQDATHADSTAGTPALTGGHVATSVPANGAILVKITNPSAPLTLFTDDFEDGDSNGWTPSGGTWQVQQPAGQSKEYARTGTGDALSRAGSSTWTNYRVQGYVKLDNEAGGAALLGRVQDNSHFYQLELKKDAAGTKKWWIWKNDGGTWTVIASGPFAFTAGSYYLLRLDMSGSTLSASVSTTFGSSFQSLGSGTDSAYTSGAIGVRAVGHPASFDDLRVSSL